MLLDIPDYTWHQIVALVLGLVVVSIAGIMTLLEILETEE